MANRDDDRRRDYIDDLNRQRDREDFDKAQADRTASVYRKLREGDLAGAGWVLGVPPAGAMGAGAVTSRHQPTAGEQFSEHTNRARFNIKHAYNLPSALRENWSARIRALDIEKPHDSLRELAAVRAEYKRWRQDAQPPARDLNVLFEMEIPKIGEELSWLAAILNHVIGQMDGSNPSR